MTADELTAFLRHSIPVLKAIDIQVRECSPQRVLIAAPLAANHNHHNTAFGGSLALISILSGWALLHVGLSDEQVDARLVVQRSECRFERPVSGDLLSEARRPDAGSWSAFIDTLRRRGKARIDLQTRVLAGGGDAVLHSATFAASLHRAST
ncbi:YiiD C-terminal domain-containing protein [Hydrocarboniphaga sp.]|uniref:YiiD C-terminal domain-containing protein n=1 Tax=Hydrocarboniphaga sp. TaxID=2033016 RepID=UPI003D114D9F